MGMANEFKTFIARGNVMDMAVGIIMGAAFTTIVKSLVSDVIMPPIGLVTGGVDFTNLFINLGEGEFESLKAAQEAGAATINYGVFLNAVISFLIVAFVVFMLVKQVNRLKDMAEKEEEAAPEAPAEPSAEEKLLTEIRDLMAAQAKG
jgi:large conductance mechanosensitive channel